MGPPTKDTILKKIERRKDILFCFYNGKDTKKEISDRLDVSRSTVQRGVNELYQADILEKSHQGYRLTPFGRLVIEEYDRFLNSISTFRSATPLLKNGVLEVISENRILVGGNVLLPSPPNIYEPFHLLLEQCVNSSTVKGLTGITECISILIDCLETDSTIQVVIESECHNYFKEKDEDILSHLIRSEKCSVWWTEESPEFSFFIIDDDYLWVAIHDEMGGIAGVITNTQAQPVNWAQNEFEKYRGGSTQMILRGASNRESSQANS